MPIRPANPGETFVDDNGALIIATYKYSLCAAPASAIVGQVSSVIVEPNLQRKGLLIRNLSVNTVSIAFGVPAELNKGVTLYGKECFSMNSNETSLEYVSAIAGGDNSALAIQEFSIGTD